MAQQHKTFIESNSIIESCLTSIHQKLDSLYDAQNKAVISEILCISRIVDNKSKWIKPRLCNHLIFIYQDQDFGNG